MATATVVAGLSLVTAVIAVSRHQEAEARRLAEAEALRAEAGKLLALGQTFLEDDPTAALAYARGSLELFDTPGARTFAMKALWRGPIALSLPVERLARQHGLPESPHPIGDIAFSPDGRWLATIDSSNRRVLLFPREGGAPRALPRDPEGNAHVLAFGSQGDVLVTGGAGESLRFWSYPDLREVGDAELGGLWSWGFALDSTLLTGTQVQQGAPFRLRLWSPPGQTPRDLGTLALPPPWTVDPSGTTVAYASDRSIRVRPLESESRGEDRLLGTASDDVQDIRFAPGGNRVASLDRSGEIRVWSMAADSAAPLHVLRGPPVQFSFTWFDPEGRLLTQLTPQNAFLLWELDGSPETQPISLRRVPQGAVLSGEFAPGGEWLATSLGVETVEFWPLRGPWARVIRGLPTSTWRMGFTSDSRWLATCSLGEPARLWPLSASGGRARDLAPSEQCASLATSATRSEVLVGTGDGEVLLVPVDGGPPRPLGGWQGAAMAFPVSFDPEGRRALAAPYGGGGGLDDPKTRVLRVWDIESGGEQVVSLADLTGPDWGSTFAMGFGVDGSLYGPLGNGAEVVRLKLPDARDEPIESETLHSAGSLRSTLSPDGRLLLVTASARIGTHNFEYETLLLFDLAERTSRPITTHGTRLGPAAAFGPSGRVIVTGDMEGVVRIGPVTGEEPHLLLGHEGPILSVAVSPDERWIASASDETVHLWPMPDVSKPPLHTLPYEELKAKLDTLTNTRVVRDTSSSTGWKLDVGPFPGWEDVPTW